MKSGSHCGVHWASLWTLEVPLSAALDCLIRKLTLPLAAGGRATSRLRSTEVWKLPG